MKNQTKSRAIPVKKSNSNVKRASSFARNRKIIIFFAILVFAAFGAFGYKLLQSSNSSEALSVVSKYKYPSIEEITATKYACPNSPDYWCVSLYATQANYAPNQWFADYTLAKAFSFRIRIGSDCTSAITSPWQSASSSSGWYNPYWYVTGAYTFKLKKASQKTPVTYYYSAKTRDANGKYSYDAKSGLFCGTYGWIKAQSITL